MVSESRGLGSLAGAELSRPLAGGGEVRMRGKLAFIAMLALLPLVLGLHAKAAEGPGFKGSTILVIRHAEKPASKADGPGLTHAGQIRAGRYVDYFGHFELSGAPIRIDTLVATADSRGSMRPRLTLTPLSQAVGLPIQQPFDDDDVSRLVGWLGNRSSNRVVLIAWHHGMIPSLLTDLGADPAALLPEGKWPPDTYDWVIVLRYGEDGNLVSSRRIVEPATLGAN
jgi:hypothetical protein